MLSWRSNNTSLKFTKKMENQMRKLKLRNNSWKIWCFDIDWQDISKLYRAVASHIMPTMNYFDSYISNGTNTLVHLRMVAHNLSLYDEMGRSTFHIVKFNNICTHKLNWSVQTKRTIPKETVNNIFISDFIK